MAKPPTTLKSVEEIRAMLRQVPHEMQLDLVQFGLDLFGIVNPAADAANAAISLWRGDLFGAAISAISIIPVGDVVKVAKLGKYAKTFESLVTRVIPSNPALYKDLEPAMEQFRTIIAKIPAGNESIEAIRGYITTFFKNAELQRLASGAVTLAAKAQRAAARGRWADNAFAKAGTNADDVVKRLMNAAENGNHPSLKQNARKMIEDMSDNNWVITAGPHKTTATAGNTLDQTPHITIEIQGQPNPFHLRLDAQGHIWEVRTVQKVSGQTKAVNPLPGTPRPWKGPGQ